MAEIKEIALVKFLIEEGFTGIASSTERYDNKISGFMDRGNYQAAAALHCLQSMKSLEQSCGAREDFEIYDPNLDEKSLLQAIRKYYAREGYSEAQNDNADPRRGLRSFSLNFRKEDTIESFTLTTSVILGKHLASVWRIR